MRVQRQALLAGLACAGFVGSAAAQSLALSYKLTNEQAESAKQALIALNRCSGFNWVTSLGACGRELMQRVTAPLQPGQPESDGPAKAAENAAADPVYKAEAAAPAAPRAVTTASTSEKLPTLGVPVPMSLIRKAGGKEELLGNARNVDIMFRFGSKYRFRSGDEGWEWYRFTEAGYDTRMKMNAHKGAGVELVVPFE